MKYEKGKGGLLDGKKLTCNELTCNELERLKLQLGIMKKIKDETELTYYDYVKMFLTCRRDFIEAKNNLIREQNKRFLDIDKKYYSNKDKKE